MCWNIIFQTNFLKKVIFDSNLNAPQSLSAGRVNLKRVVGGVEVNMINQALEAQGGMVACSGHA